MFNTPRVIGGFFIFKKMAKRGPKGPSKYTKSYLEEIADKLEDWIQIKTNVWLGDFAAENNMNRHDLSREAPKSEKLFATYKKAKQVQENRLVKLGFSKGANAAFVIFTLKNVAGWRDKTEIEHTGGLLNKLLSEISDEKESIVKNRDRQFKKESEEQEVEIK